MPRKLRSPKARIDAVLSPALMYFMMVGASAPARMPGWVAAAQLGPDLARTLAQSWRAYGAVLTRDADAAGFRPFWQTKHRPTGDGFAQWRAAFLAEHTY